MGDTALLVGSEVSGFVHLLAVDPLGDIGLGTNSSRDLTPLPCETADWALSRGGTRARTGDDATGGGGDDTLFVAHNCDLADSPGVARINVRTGERSIVFEGTATHMGGLAADSSAGLLPIDPGPDGGPLDNSSAAVAFLASSFNFSSQVFVDDGSGATTARRMLTGFGDLPPAVRAFAPPRLVEFPSLDGQFTIHAQLFSPPAGSSSDPGPNNPDPNPPAVIFTHGGSQRQMYGAMHFSPAYAGLYALNQFMALAGGASVLSINYRSGVGYGRAFRLCEGTDTKCGWRGGLEYDDVKAGRQWLQTTLAPSAVGIHGLSYGGLNCLQALSRDSASYAAGACNAPVFNHVTSSDGPFKETTFSDGSWRQLEVGPEPDLNGPGWSNSVQHNVALSWTSSPAAFVQNWTAPVLLIHGDADADVDFQESLGVVRALRRRAREGGGETVVETLVRPDETHGMALFEHQLLAAEASYDFLGRFLALKPRPA
jgi:dipeptidyl aminopeptidase/acylaminoacyl peptidase